MQLRRRLLSCLICLLMVVLVARLIPAVTASEGGWHGYLRDWIRAACLTIGISRPRLDEWEPHDQGAFWLREVRRIKGADQDSQLARGAAWMLDSPQYGFKNLHRRIGNSGYTEIDERTITLLEHGFETSYREQCLHQIDLASKLDPANVDVWRAKAQLLFHPFETREPWQARRLDCLSVLDECARHDPQNALYDYLAALFLWSHSATSEFIDSDKGWRLTVQNVDEFQSGNRRLKSGLAKPYLRFGASDYVAVQQFLNQSLVPRDDGLNAIESRVINVRPILFSALITRWFEVFRDDAVSRGEFDQAVGVFLDCLTLAKQVTRVGNSVSFHVYASVLPRWAFANIKNLKRKHPENLAAAEPRDVDARLNSARRETALLNGSFEQLVAAAAPRSLSDESNLKFLLATLQMLLLGSLAVAFLSKFLGWAFADGQPEVLPRRYWAWQIFSGLIGFELSLTVSRIVMRIWPNVLETRSVAFNDYEHSQLVRLPDAQVLTLWLQWRANLGPLTTVLFGVGTLFVVHLCHCAWASPKNSVLTWREARRSQFALGCRIIGQACCRAALVLGIVYLALAPLERQPSTWEHSYRFLFDPDEAWKEIDAEIARRRSDQSVMQWIEKEVARQNEVDEQDR